MILFNNKIAENIYRLGVHSPEIAKKHRAGQFVILRIEASGERIPLTIASVDRENGIVILIYQVVGKTTLKLSQLPPGKELLDLAGPLGRPSDIQKEGQVVCVGGGIGIAPLYPIARALKKIGNRIVSILGAKNKDRLILEQEMREVSDDVHIMTDDGSAGRKGLVTHALQALYACGIPIHRVIAIGPPIMMQLVSELTYARQTPTTVSLNPIMVDGTGMCGGCRVLIGGKSKFACVDGPEFDGHQVNYNVLKQRLEAYQNQEKRQFESALTRPEFSLQPAGSEDTR